MRPWFLSRFLSIVGALLVGVLLGAALTILLVVLLWGPQPTWPLRSG